MSCTVTQPPLLWHRPPTKTKPGKDMNAVYSINRPHTVISPI